MLIAFVAAGGLCGHVLAQNIAAMPAPSTVAAGAPKASPGEERAGFVKSVEGTVRIIGSANRSRTAEPGDALAPSDRLETGEKGGASVVLRDGTLMMVGPSSQLDLKQFSFDSTTHEGNIFVELLRGSLRMVTGLIGKKNPEAVRVDTQTATIGIRGTDFIVTADPAP